MSNGKNKHHVSFWFWMLAIFVMAIPCIGFIMIIVWAFVGENESRKNYFKAVIAWTVIVFVIWLSMMLLGFWPMIYRAVERWLHQLG